ncbi:MAG: chemotaxis-specific protein-glutamate methyltransferase CheB [Pseudomonadota bacterium]
MINVLIVEDSLTESILLKGIIEAEPDMKVIGHARNGQEAVKMCATLKPDLITMDIEMPVLDGIDATRLIMTQTPIPVVVISSTVNNKLLNATFKALEAGAVSVLQKPENITSHEFVAQRTAMIDTLRSMAEIKVVKRRFNVKSAASVVKPFHVAVKSEHYEIIALGVSIGGPQVLNFILQKLPVNFPLPIVIVQHMAPGFIEGFAKWLDENVEIKVKLAGDHEILQAGTAYFAADGAHLTVVREGSHLKTKLVKSAPVSGFRPSATVLLESVATACGQRAVGGLLTGMGNDGAQGLLELKNKQGTTFIQDQDSAVVWGMAGVAQSLGAAEQVVKLDDIASYLLQIVKK